MKPFSHYILAFLMAWLACLGQTLAFANVTLTTYYPSPMGEYDNFRLSPRSGADLAGNCAIGSFYVNASGTPKYCAGTGPNGTWGDLPAVWTQNGDDITLTDDPGDTFVGIGTPTPSAKLTLINNAGIIATGNFGAGEALPDGLTDSRLIWYPAKAAFRAGYVNGNQWDDSNIGNYSIAMGKETMASGAYSTVGGGENNSITSQYSSIIGGKNNQVSGDYSAIIGGFGNSNTGSSYSFINGGSSNAIINPRNYSTIVGGQSNQLWSSYSVIGGGSGNSIELLYSNINGGQDNLIEFGGDFGSTVIAGGRNNKTYHSNIVISGGENNQADTASASIGGGKDNTAGVTTHGVFARVSGGQNNQANTDYSTVGGGYSNKAMHVNGRDTVAGGSQNTASGGYSTIVGGENNIVQGPYAVVLGGSDNRANGDYSLAFGKNIRLDSSADRSFAWGYSDTPVDISANDSFIIAPGSIGSANWNPKVGIRDLTPGAVLEFTGQGNIASFQHYLVVRESTDAVQFIVRSNGRIGVQKTDPAGAIHFGNANDAYLSTGGVWTNGSSRSKKENIKPLESDLAQSTLYGLNVVTFQYKVKPTETRAGFIAEEVPETVALDDRKHLSAMDIVAVLTKAAQDQHQKIEEHQDLIKKIKIDIAELERSLDKQ